MFRKIHSDFWTDVDIEDYTPDQKYFYLYLISNPFSNQIGIYEFSPKQASLHTGLSIKDINELIQFFEYECKLMKSQVSKEIALLNFYCHNRNGSPATLKCCKKLIDEVKDKSLLNHVCGLEEDFDIEYIEVKEIKEVKEVKEVKEIKEVKEEIEVIHPYDTPDYIRAWNNWKDYKWKQHKFKFKSIQSEQAAVTKLGNMSSSADKAIELIHNAMANGWKGFWLVNENKNKDVKDYATIILNKRGFKQTNR